MPSKIRVLETIRQGQVGGGETHVLDLVQALDKSQFEPVVLSFTPGPMIDRLMAMGVRTHVIHTERPFNVATWRRVKRLLREERIDLVHAHGTRAHSNTFWAARQLGLPVIYTVHGWSFHLDQKPLARKACQLAEKLLMRQAGTTICVSESNRRDGLKFSDMTRAVVIKNGINLHRFNPSLRTYNVRAELGIAPDVVLVGYIARMTAQKDPFTMLRAVAALPAGLNVKFLLVGNGDLKAGAQQLARALGIEAKVIFTDFRQDIPDVLQALDIYCLPSLWEGLPIGILEAMAMGKPVIASSIEATKEIIEHGVNGLLVPIKAPAQLAAAIQQLASSQELRRTLGAHAYQTIQAGFTAEAMTRQVEQLYLQQVPRSAGGERKQRLNPAFELAIEYK
ncbi:glycosyltransferase family 4 protein [Hymenobacter artigasi]|uniref:Glycosyltransferase involved in cell wall biosynthesis n=1 Tax=Hymenobacter artigasi TaxID=2719616 RepID=A0ABX1HGQ3_9BACT|nr:glycosyltransferase family 4 protein [Hymenobacter artigasi]NKI89375.1 glycosyltransferase involved in cell wall biosynthesis [Hymenobacter artigasi]